MEFGTGGGALRFVLLVVRSGEEILKPVQVFCCVGRRFQDLQSLTNRLV